MSLTVWPFAQGWGMKRAPQLQNPDSTLGLMDKAQPIRYFL
jgi:hypothetical protein